MIHARRTRRARAALLLSSGAMVAVAVAGCGGTGSFKNQPRPPAPVQLTGVVTNKQVTISPNHIGAGPVIIVVSNQTDSSHTIVLERATNEGSGARDTVGPVNPLSAATLSDNLTNGEYSVSVDNGLGSIQPATIIVGPERRSSSGQLLLP
jgi:hypothetical protein